MTYLVQLRSFLDVYRAGSISKAANRLGLSQPAVSSHIHSLESYTGCDFDYIFLISFKETSF